MLTREDAQLPSQGYYVKDVAILLLFHPFFCLNSTKLLQLHYWDVATPLQVHYDVDLLHFCTYNIMVLLHRCSSLSRCCYTIALLL